MVPAPPTQSARRPAGYLLLRQRHALNCLPHHVESFVTHGTRHTHSVPGRIEETYPRTYWPGDSDFAHLEFALKREGLHLQLLRALLPRLSAEASTAYVRSKPTSAYARRIWFLYESFSGIRLDLPDVTQGNYVDLLSGQHAVIRVNPRLTPLSQPGDFDFLFQRLEFGVAGDEFGFLLFRQRGGKGVGIGNAVPSLQF